MSSGTLQNITQMHDYKALHNSRPCLASSAEKKTEPDAGANSNGSESACPGQMSLTSAVPAAVPSLFHSSSPWSLSNAMNTTVPPTSTRFWGSSPSDPGGEALTMLVPASVPSLFQSCRPPVLVDKTCVETCTS